MTDEQEKANRLAAKLAKRQAKQSVHTEQDRHAQKLAKRAATAAAKAAQQSSMPVPTVAVPNEFVDCACVIHGDGYSWDYVEKLYNMLFRHINKKVRFHVYTEHNRSVPPHMIKHTLTEWPGISGRKKSWWYKLQLFNSQHHQGPLLYLDLDTVIVNSLDWVANLSTNYLWAIKDYRCLWKPQVQTLNSSVMYWDTRYFDWVWQDFAKNNISTIKSSYQGDQDYLSAVIDPKKRRFFEEGRCVSWRWQALNGGMDWKKRRYKIPGQGTSIQPQNSVLVFHGNPKPSEIADSVINFYWK